MAHVKLGDNVQVITGKDKGKIGVIISISLKNDRVKVKGVALATHYCKARKNNEKSCIKILESFIHSSNVKKIIT